MNIEKIYRLSVASLLGIGAFGSARAHGAEVAQLTLTVDPVAHTWSAYEQNSDTSLTSGLAGLQFNVTGAGGIVVDSSFNDLPQGLDPQIGTTGFTVLRSDGSPAGFEIRGYQSSTFKQNSTTAAQNVVRNEGNGSPVWLADGTFTGDTGNLTISSDATLVTLLPSVLPTPTRTGVDYNTFSPDSVVGQTVAVPEPATGLLGLGITAFALLRRPNRA